jgi:hypothetical protein
MKCAETFAIPTEMERKAKIGSLRLDRGVTFRITLISPYKTVPSTQSMPEVFHSPHSRDCDEQP